MLLGGLPARGLRWSNEGYHSRREWSTRGWKARNTARDDLWRPGMPPTMSDMLELKRRKGMFRLRRSIARRKFNPLNIDAPKIWMGEEKSIMNLVAGGELCSSAGRLMLLTIALFLLGTNMVHYSISIQPALSPNGFTVAHCCRALLLKFERTMIAIKRGTCCRQQIKCFFRG
jgi:hypothetical protein